MLWWILGLACIGFVGLAVAFLIHLERVEKSRRQHVFANGTAVIGWLVQANNALFQPGTSGDPAQVLISFPGDRAASIEELADLAERVARLKSARPADAVEKQVTRLVRDETYRPTERYLLPREFTGGLEVYSVHIYVERNLLPEGRITTPYFHCVAIPGDEGVVYMLPYPEEENTPEPVPRTTRE
jgi:hypothetical protein